MKSCIQLLVCALALGLAPAARALSLYALTTDNRLLIIDSAVPQNVASVVNITGLAAGEEVLGIDVRPATAQLYALSRGPGGARLFTLDPATGAATLVASLSAEPTDLSNPFTALAGAVFAIDFNPVADRLRVVSDTAQNLRINPGNGAVTTDLNLNYAAGDPNQGDAPNIAAIAYTPNVAGATTLFGIDDTAFRVVTQNPPNDGTLNSGAAFGALNAAHPGFDIAPDGIAYVGGKHTVPGQPIEFVLVTLDPLTGGGESLGPIADGTVPIRDLAVAPTVSFSAAEYAVDEAAGGATITVRREGFLNTAAAVQYTTRSDSASAASDYVSASGTLAFNAGEDMKAFQVPIVNDSVPEDDEFLDLLLTGLTGQGVLGFPSTASLRINPSELNDRVGPRAVFIGLTGPSRGIDGVVVQFDEDLNLATAQNTANYRLVVFPRRGRPQSRAFTSAVYDPVGRRVTLELAPFMQTNFRRLAIVINGRPGGVTDVAGNLLDGDRNRRPGGSAVQLFQIFSGTTVRFADRDGDRVEITIAEGGRLDGIRPLGGAATQLTQFWILDPISLISTLSGRVTRSPRGGDGIVVISEIIGLDKKEFTPLLTNPSFRVNTLTFSSNATGIGAR